MRQSELGGMLWLISQLRNTQEERNKISKWAENSLQPLINDGLASEINVTTDFTVRRMVLKVHINVKEGGTRKFEYWINTDLGNAVNDN